MGERLVRGTAQRLRFKHIIRVLTYIPCTHIAHIYIHTHAHPHTRPYTHIPTHHTHAHTHTPTHPPLDSSKLRKRSLGKANLILFSVLGPLPPLPRQLSVHMSLCSLLHPVCSIFLSSQPLWGSNGSCRSFSKEMQVAHSVFCSFVGAYRLPEASSWIL